MIDTRFNKECPCTCDKECELEDMTQDGHWLCLGSKCEMLVRADERAKVTEEFREYLKTVIPCEMPQDVWNMGVDNTCNRILKEKG